MACGEDDATTIGVEPDAPAVTVGGPAVAVTDEPDEALLERMTLRLSDLPAGCSQSPDDDGDHDGDSPLFDGCEYPADDQALIDASGTWPEVGHEYTGASGLVLSSGTVAAPDDGVAAELQRWVGGVMERCVGVDDGATTIVVEPVDYPAVGDGTLALCLVAEGPAGSAMADHLIVREGRFLSTLTMTATMGVAIDSDQVIALLELIDERG